MWFFVVFLKKLYFSLQRVRMLWYANGLRFSCVKCGQCCGGAPGNIWVDQSEIENISDLLGISVGKLKNRYLRKIENKFSVREKLDGFCVFYQSGVGCSIYLERPRQCRSWPFWDRNLASPDDWKEILRICPGAGLGELISGSEIEKRREMIKL
jgi:uncharacterized protein